ncbi:winged helix-turn-helix transcriptional regulator [Halomicrococcus gelatinilyticus]|uniref:winged helix-turn-helix transcriptional regulator n=1 Tax=Halomicrococcus gelatinilyticus TaxID=1702103 RepID=UPI002E13FBCF
MAVRSSEANDAGDLRRAFVEVGDLLGRKWHLLILSQLLEDGAAGFNELKREGDISSKVLSDALGDLEANGFVSREVVDDRPIRVEYRLAERGVSFGRVLLEIRAWHHQQDGTAGSGRTAAIVDPDECPDWRPVEGVSNGRT